LLYTGEDFVSYIHFFDDWSLISYHNLQRRLGKPCYQPHATLEDALTEGTWNFPTVTRLPDTGKYIGLYGAAADCPNADQYVKKLNMKFRPRNQVLCYAQSYDGIHWTRPDLTDISQFEGPRHAPNQVFGSNYSIDGAPVYYDPYDPDPNRRFKYLVNMVPALHHPGHRALAVSPDAIHWDIAHEFHQLPSTDTPSSVFYHHEKQCYILNVRAFGGDRRIFFQETTDWENFSEPQLIMHPDPQDPPLVGFYGMPVFRYENLFIGLLWWIHADPSTGGLPNGPIDCALAYSYDGSHFNRAYHRPFIERNELGEHGGGCIYAGSMLVDENHTIRFYSGGSKAEHFQNQSLTDAALILHTLRLDGFVYFATPAGKGSLRTRPITITGDDLRINARSPWGGIRVQILDEKAQPLPGFTYEDCEPLFGDELFWTPRWKNGKTFGQAKSDLRRQIEIEINTGEIFALRGDFEKLTCYWPKPDKNDTP
jgi:hypothetical protein